MSHPYVFALGFGLASGLLWRLARTGRGAGLGLAVAGLVLLLGGLVSLALAAALAPAGPVLAWLFAPLAALSQRLLPDLEPLLGAQLGVLIASLLLRLGLIALLWVAASVQRRWQRLRPPRHIVRPDLVATDWAGTAGVAAALRLILLVTGLILATLPFWGDRGAQPTTVLAAFVWIGYWLLLIELAGHSEARRPAAGATDIDGDDVRAAAEHQLEQLYRLYIGRHREMLFGCRRREAAPHLDPELRPALASGSPSPTGGRAAALLQARWEHRLSANLLQRLVLSAAEVDAGHDLLLGESLCSHHFVLIAALVQDCIDHGRSVLLLCPAASVDAVRDSLALHADPNLYRLTQAWAVLGRDDLSADADPDVLLCPDSELEQALPLSALRNQHALIRLGLIVCFDVQAMNVPLARFALARLRQVAEPSTAVRLVMQAAHYAGVETLARALHSPQRLLEMRVSAWLQTTRYLLVWDRDHEPLDPQRALYFGKLQERVAPEWLLLLLPWELGLTVTRFDPGNRHDEDAFERLRGYLPRYDHDDKVAAAATHRPISHGCVGAGAAVSLLDDPGNLLVALDHDGGSSGLRASLINVLCGNYLLRDYLRARMAVASPEDLPDALRPLAAQPLGNPYTLAYALSRAFAASATLTAVELRDQFLDPSPSHMLRALGIRASRQGLQHLFDQVFGSGAAEVAVHRLADGRTAYALNPNRPLLRAAYLSAVNEQGDPLGRLLASDHGLTYAVGQTLLLAHKFHRVVGVSAERVEIRHVDAVANQPRERYFFHRRYRLPDLGPDAVAQSGDAQPQRLGDGLALTLSFALRTVERDTLGYLTLAEGLRPFARGGAACSYTPCESITQTYRFQSVTRLTIDGVGPWLDGDADPDRLARLAFTLCALLQDAMASVFPDHQARLAIVSPQARVIGADRALTPPDAAAVPTPDSPSSADLEQFLGQLYPSLSVDVPTPAPAAGGASGIDIYFIEDSAFDLGVARALGDRSKLEHLLRLIRHYLHWAVAQPAAPLYHGFGAAAPGAAFDYPRAQALLDRLLQTEEAPSTGALGRGCTEPGLTASVTVAECDFCAAPLAATYERLDDGRCRCPSCTAQAVNTKAGFRGIFREVVEHLEGDYGIALRRDLRVRFVNANGIAAVMDQAFVPTSAMDPRTVGLAVRHTDGAAELLLENGAPQLSTVATLAHELTHLWQFSIRTDLDQVPLETVEGQARFIEVDYLRRHGGQTLAAAIVRESRFGNDVYSRGYRQIEAACGGEGQRVFDCFERQLRGGR